MKQLQDDSFIQGSPVHFHFRVQFCSTSSNQYDKLKTQFSSGVELEAVLAGPQLSPLRSLTGPGRRRRRLCTEANP